MAEIKSQARLNALMKDWAALPPEAQAGMANALAVNPLSGPGGMDPDAPMFGSYALRLEGQRNLRNAEIEHALRYPERVARRLFGMPGGVSERYLDTMGHIVPIEAVAPGYEPGPRVSGNVEDRRPNSLWSYY